MFGLGLRTLLDQPHDDWRRRNRKAHAEIGDLVAERRACAASVQAALQIRVSFIISMSAPISGAKASEAHGANDQSRRSKRQLDVDV